MEAVSLAGTIVQFTQVGLEFFSRFFALCRSANGTLEEITEQEKQVQALLQHIADLEALYPNQNRNEETKACRKILEQLLRMVDSTKGNGKPHITSNIKTAARAMKIKH
ncbi:hypothetical protein BDV41DRAFT_576302 [Aspergillus transmontanensis]|uniref:Fungal N-terminal domain-containing protein n=1 Tax=Aspergillus transmontanensis TaxID=1034304 RepID=A0A5N6VZB9_9EURO|nr:hypothetical protein BDV41DRAFT_576302 [Aspergillus transmontanensis]